MIGNHDWEKYITENVGGKWRARTRGPKRVGGGNATQSGGWWTEKKLSQRKKKVGSVVTIRQKFPQNGKRVTGLKKKEREKNVNVKVNHLDLGAIKTERRCKQKGEGDQFYRNLTLGEWVSQNGRR